MIDLDRIEEWNKNDLGDEEYEVQAIVSKGDLLDIITSLRQAEKDAARYRFLKEQFNNENWTLNGEERRKIEIVMWVNDGFDNCNYGEEVIPGDIDGIIDEAMKCK